MRHTFFDVPIVRSFLVQSGSDLPALNGSLLTHVPGALGDTSLGPYSCRAAAMLTALRSFTGIGDAPVLMPLQPWLPPPATSAFPMQLEQLALLPSSAGGSLDTVAVAVTNDCGDAVIPVPGGGGPDAPSATLPAALRLALTGDYMAWWNYGRVGEG